MSHHNTQLHYSTTFTQPTHPTIKMSAPNANKPNEGIIGQIGNSISNAANYVSETVQGNSAEASKEANKQQAKGNVPGQDSVTDRVSGALGAAGDKMDQTKHEGSAEANKRSI
ncbi:Ras- protein rsr1 [Didymella glomerata]|uniref:Ras- protein rsr1 n=1 Tax=Didymella glomerata TaxID=749621 RepID=A0A9W8X5C0_9PLEO|nr:Ras- protein rsr1 [Didymella glomerata]